jgi:hypothetical protein
MFFDPLPLEGARKLREPPFYFFSILGIHHVPWCRRGVHSSLFYRAPNPPADLLILDSCNQSAPGQTSVAALSTCLVTCKGPLVSQPLTRTRTELLRRRCSSRRFSSSLHVFLTGPFVGSFPTECHLPKTVRWYLICATSKDDILQPLTTISEN